jgi:hypothetical protein
MPLFRRCSAISNNTSVKIQLTIPVEISVFVSVSFQASELAPDLGSNISTGGLNPPFLPPIIFILQNLFIIYILFYKSNCCKQYVYLYKKNA